MDLHTLCTQLDLDEASQRVAQQPYMLCLEEGSVGKVQKSLALLETSALRLAMAVRLAESIPLSPTLASLKAAQRIQHTGQVENLSKLAQAATPMGGWNPYVPVGCL